MNWMVWLVVAGVGVYLAVSVVLEVREQRRINREVEELYERLHGHR